MQSKQANGTCDFFFVFFFFNPKLKKKYKIYKIYKRHKITKKGDANVVLYCGGRPLWASNTYRYGTPRVFIMQNDGNLVLYTTRRSVWDSQGRTKNVRRSLRQSAPYFKKNKI